MELKFSSDFRAHVSEIEALYRATFTASEGAREGVLIGKLARELLGTTEEGDLLVFSAWQAGDLAGCIVFSRLWFDQDDRRVFILAPVAVRPGLQGRGVGRRLLEHGLDRLRENGIDVAVTYGDPDYYSRVGFVPITEAIARAPRPLSHPHGWLAQSLTDRPLDQLKGPSRCVEALDRPEYW